MGIPLWHPWHSFLVPAEISLLKYPFTPHPHQHLLCLIFFILATLTGVRWYLTAVLVCISLMVGYVKHLFMYLLVTYRTSWNKCLLRSFFKIFFLTLPYFIIFVWLYRVQPNARLNPTSLGSEPEPKSRVGCSTDWATQVPPFTWKILKNTQTHTQNIDVIKRNSAEVQDMRSTHKIHL